MLPIHQVIPELKQALSQHQRVVLSAPPGSGKTTIVPLELLDEPWLAGQRILLLEPRRLAARSCANRMADLLQEPLGKRVGYRIRFERCLSVETRIEVVTEGILTRLIQRDPELSGVGLIVFDEFHERSLHGDLALTLSLDLAENLRDDLRLLVMSATLNRQQLKGVLGDPPFIEGEGSVHSVACHYLQREVREHYLVDVAVNGIRRAIREEQGDILVFLPGVGEIKRVQLRLQEQLIGDLILCPLYGDLDKVEQERAIRPDAEGRRRVILATSIAETSLTIDGVTVVVDSGWTRQPSFDPNTALSRLQTVRVSKAAATQRMGRAGRLAPGVCYRLWTRATQAQLQEDFPPEILRVDLMNLVLELAQWGVTDPQQLTWVDPPPAGSYARARQLLQQLELVDHQGRLTEAGNGVISLGVDPRLGHLLVVAGQSGQAELAVDMIALLSERDLLVGEQGSAKPVDLELRLKLLDGWRRNQRSLGVDRRTCQRIERVRRQLLDRSKALPRSTRRSNVLSPGALLLAAYPDRAALCRDISRGSYQMAMGRRVRLPEGDHLTGREALLVASLDAGEREGRIFLAAEITLQEIRQQAKRLIRKEQQLYWDKGCMSVVAEQVELLDKLELSRRTLDQPDPDRVSQTLLRAITDSKLEMLPWTEAAEVLRQRITFMRHREPEGNWPDCSDDGLLATLDVWLTPWIRGIRKGAELKRLEMVTLLRSGLSWEQQQALERLAPSHFVVPSGSRRRIDYSDPEAPVLAVRLQELFGSIRTPAIYDNRVPLQLHLLSPAQRPIQITSDLENFWKQTYIEVKKELKGRYPKHYWPDDPLQAEATARVRPKKG